MTPYVRRYIPDDEIVLFEEVSKRIQALPDIDLGVNEMGRPIVLSCHMLARAVARVFHLPYCDGYFHRVYRHSWVCTPTNNIIDVYPIAMIGGPILYDGNVGSPARLLYTKTSAIKISDGTFNTKSFRRSVERIRRAL